MTRNLCLALSPLLLRPEQKHTLSQDLSKLCGVEVAVIIVGEKKTCDYASTDMNRILERYQTMQAGATQQLALLQESETSRLWAQLEAQRRELESLTRELAARDAMLQQQQGILLPPPVTAVPLTITESLNFKTEADTQPTVQSILDSTAQTILAAQETMEEQSSKKRSADIAELSDDTAEVEEEDSVSDIEGEREAKRVRHEVVEPERKANIEIGISAPELVAVQVVN